MSDFQEQAKNWLRNVVKQNPDKIKAGVEKAGDLIDKQTGGKYAEKVDTVQHKVGTYVDSHNAENPQATAEEPQSTGSEAGTTTTDSEAGTTTATAENGAAESGPDDGAPEAASQAGTSGQAGTSDQAGTSGEAGGVPEAGGGGDPEAGGGVVGGELPDPSSEPASSAGSRPEGTQTGGTVTGQPESTESEEGLPGPRG